MSNYATQTPKEQEPCGIAPDSPRVPAMADLIKHLASVAESLSREHQMLRNRLGPFCRPENSSADKAQCEPTPPLPDALNEIRGQIQTLKDVEDGLRSIRNRLEI